MKSKSKIVAAIYRHTELCDVCGKEGQWYEQSVYFGEVPKVSFCRAAIPVGWSSAYDGVFCSDECYKQAIIAKEKGHE